MSDRKLDQIESVLKEVSPGRRSFLRGLLIAGAEATALALPSSILIADDDGGQNGGSGRSGGCQGGGKGKGKKGKGKGNNGNGNGNGNGGNDSGSGNGN